MDHMSTRGLLNAHTNGDFNSTSTFDPDYVREASDGRRSVSRPLALTLGTGYSIYKDCIIPAIKAAEQEVILVTCFWAKSVTLNEINDALRQLSEKALASSSKISVHICFSSSSLPRNMLLPTPKKGQAYQPSEWHNLGLPRPHELTGLSLRITRKFFWPLGIIHSKYVIIDREVAIFPSCNVSWERWYEAAISMQGPVVEHLLSFHTTFWDGCSQSVVNDPFEANSVAASSHSQSQLASGVPQATAFGGIQPMTTLLPSPHTSTLLPNYLQPQSLVGQLPCFPSASHTFPPTPLLRTAHYLLSTAKTTVIMLTPNLTEPAVLEALDRALERGVSVCLWTNRKLMTLEQLVTAGTTTPRCVQALVKRSKALRGSLMVSFFDSGPWVKESAQDNREITPIKLHAKVTIVDGERILLGSGNMDAASWKTSQELGILVESREVVEEFKKGWKYGKLD